MHFLVNAYSPYPAMGCSNIKLCWCIGYMMSRVLGNILCELTARSRSNNVFSCKCIFFLTMGCSNIKLGKCIDQMKSRVLGNSLCDPDPLDLGVKIKYIFS